jgi:amidase
MADRPLWQLGAVELASAIRSGDVRVTDAVASALERMDEVNPAVNAVTVSLADRAMAQAEAAQRETSSGRALGPLHGVPVTIKENIDQEGLANTNGLPGLADNIAPADSPVARNLREAGAIVLGRTNTPEFSYRWFTDNPLRGRTLNPWNADITPGGSSGGAASSVALGVGAIAHGNDLGGSLRYPAYACGVATIKPGLGRVASFNPSAPNERPPTLQLMSVQGPIAREVRDVRLGLAVMAQPDARDPWWVPAPLRGPDMHLPIRVAMTRGPSDLNCDPAVASALDMAAGYLSDTGYAVEQVDPPCLEEAADLWRKLIGADTEELMMPDVRKLGSPLINELAGAFADYGSPTDVAGYAHLSAERTRVWREWSTFMARYPLVLGPVSQRPPFPQGADEQGLDAYKPLMLDQAMLYIVNLLGLPSAAVPTGINQRVPMGVQIIGQRFREDMCLDAAQAIENVVGVMAHRLWDQN